MVVPTAVWSTMATLVLDFITTIALPWEKEQRKGVVFLMEEHEGFIQRLKVLASAKSFPLVTKNVEIW